LTSLPSSSERVGVITVVGEVILWFSVDRGSHVVAVSSKDEDEDLAFVWKQRMRYYRIEGAMLPHEGWFCRPS